MPRANQYQWQVPGNGRLFDTQEVVAELGATLLMNGFEIEINGENLSELIDDE